MDKSASAPSNKGTTGKFGIFRLGIRNKLVLLLLAFGLVPAVSTFGMLILEEELIREDLNGRIEATAEQLNNVIDRNLFERYGDVQAFAINEAAQNSQNWGNALPENPLVRAMNAYATGYGIYKIMLLLDLNGTVVGVNTVAPDGKPLKTQGFLGQNFKNEPWFSKAAKGEFLQGRNGLTGTAVQQPGHNAIVAKIYAGDDYVIPFSAPVKDSSGKPIAVWVNFADFGLVEEIADSFYQGFVARGMGEAEITLLDSKGRIIIDYDPKSMGFSELSGYKRDPKVIGRLNLAENGNAAAQLAIKGEHGSMVATHTRKKIEQVAGYHHSSGAYDYPGLGWSTIVRIPSVQAYAALDTLTHKMIIVVLVAAGIILALGMLVGVSFAKPIIGLIRVMKELADGENHVDIPNAHRSDEIGDMARTVEVFKRNALEMEAMEAEKVEQEKRALAEKKAAMTQLADDFEARISGIVDFVSSQSTEMRSTAESMSATAEETNRQSTTVAAAAEEASDQRADRGQRPPRNCPPRSSEISRQVGAVGQIAARAGDEAERTNATVQGPGRAPAEKIGDVVNLIQRHRRADQPAGAQRHHRGGACRRGRARASRWSPPR